MTETASGARFAALRAVPRRFFDEALCGGGMQRTVFFSPLMLACLLAFCLGRAHIAGWRAAQRLPAREALGSGELGGR